MATCGYDPSMPASPLVRRPAANIAGRVALVTGGARGIGKAVCEALLENGAKVCMADINEAEGAETLNELVKDFKPEDVMFTKCNVTSDEEFEIVIEAAKKKFGHLDILINNAGIGGEEDWERLIDINLKGVMRGTLLGLKHLSDRNGVKGGMIINTSSIVGLKPSMFSPAYCASKHGVVGWSTSWGMKDNVEKTNVKVNVVCPKAVDTLMLSDAAESSVPIQRERARKFADLLRAESMSPSTVAEAFVKILEDDVSGAVLVVDSKKLFYYVNNTELLK